MNNKPLKKLNVCIGTETNEDIVIIFAEPTSKDLEELIREKCVLNVVNNLLWTKIEKREGDKNGEGKVEKERGDNQMGENNLDDKGLEHWMEIWRRERKEWQAAQNINNSKFQDNDKENNEMTDDVDEKLDTVSVDKKEPVKEELHFNMEVKTELDNIDENLGDSNVYTDYENYLRNPNIPLKKKKKYRDNERRANKKNPDKVHTCDICNKTLNSSNSLTVHKRTHTGEKPYSCSVCGKAFNNKSALNSHKNGVHSIIKQFSCEVCGKAFSASKRLTVHRKIHSENREKPYSCEECGMSFQSNAILTGHKRIHTGEKPYTCDICGKAFSLSSNLCKHTKNMHKDEKPHSCDVCGKTFVEKSRLTIHMRNHTGEKPYSCEICGKAFTAKSVFIRHQNLHTGEKVYSCSICQKVFRDGSNLSRHNKSAAHLDRIKNKDAGANPMGLNDCDNSLKEEEAENITQRS